jgi:hypothetical protein
MKSDDRSTSAAKRKVAWHLTRPSKFRAIASRPFAYLASSALSYASYAMTNTRQNEFAMVALMLTALTPQSAICVQE